ncbi:MAG: adenylate/guanylate cyclase domain-containing protein [Rhodobiaceae bacterium]|nr:adenylate/guanylate cyclase domain-containing protein [Rhodobiaceae bacterium]MCC0047885.1 adenylate/guanylate cyclase domain-containing protein [Rhodobiaceae bacterium]
MPAILRHNGVHWLTGILVAGVLLAGHILFDRQLESIRAVTFDQYQRLSPRPPSESPVVIVRIDDASLAAYGRWPWNRAKVAELVQQIADQGAAVIGIDVLFPEADGSQSGLLGDSVLADALERTNSVLAVSLGNNTTTHEAAPKAGWSVVGDIPEELPGFSGLIASLPQFNDTAKGLGVIRAVPDTDGVLRHLPVVWLRTPPGTVQSPDTRGIQIWPSFALELVRLYAGEAGFVVRMAGGGFDALRIAGTTIDLSETGTVRLWESSGAPKSVSAASVMQGDSVAALSGSIAIISPDAVGISDYRVTPTRPARAGAEVHASLIDQMLAGAYLEDMPNARGLERGWFITAALATILLSGVFARRIWTGLLFSAVLFVVPFAAGYLAYLHWGELLDPVQPAFGIFLVTAFEGYTQYRRSEERRGVLARQFGQFLSPAVVQRLMKSNTDALLGGEKREISILMTDIRGFTNLSEKLDADKLIAIVNHFLGIATEEILNRDGTIDKFMGDAVLAFWNAPLDQDDHRARALSAAQALIARVAWENDRLVERGLEPIRIGVAVESGVCSVGNFGSERRFDYTAVGSPVNRAARLESVTKKLGIPLVLGPEFAKNPPVELFQAGAFELQGIEGETPVYTTSDYMHRDS